MPLLGNNANPGLLGLGIGLLSGDPAKGFATGLSILDSQRQGRLAESRLATDQARQDLLRSQIMEKQQAAAQAQQGIARLTDTITGIASTIPEGELKQSVENSAALALGMAEMGNFTGLNTLVGALQNPAAQYGDLLALPSALSQLLDAGGGAVDLGQVTARGRASLAESKARIAASGASAEASRALTEQRRTLTPLQAESERALTEQRRRVAATAADDVRSRKIRDARQVLGLSQADAVKVVDGHSEVRQDELGNLALVDKTTGEVRPLGSTTGGAPGGVPIPAEARTAMATQVANIDQVLALMTDQLQGDTLEGTGPVAAATAATDALFGFLTPGVIGADTQAAKQRLRTFNQLAKTALVNNPKFPVAEQEIVARLLPDPDTFFENPSTSYNNLIELRNTLERLKGNLSTTLQGGPPPTPGQPQGAPGGGQDSPARPTTQQEFDALPSGALFVNPADGRVMRKK